MIKFSVKFTTGQQFEVTENSNTLLSSAIDKLLKKEKLDLEIQCLLSNGGKVDKNKTLSENQIINGGLVIIYAINKEKDTQFPFPKKPEITPKENFFKCLNFLIKICKVPINLLDNRGNCLGGWQTGRKNGPPGYLKEYFPPIGWYGIGLHAWNLYDNGNNDWIGNKNTKGEWYICYHGIKSNEALNGILLNGFRKGFYQSCKFDENINPLSNQEYPQCGEGVYFIQKFSETLKYIKTFNYMGDKYRIVFMCRVNPYKVRIAELDDDLESWIVNGDSLNDINGKKRDDEVRIYRILMHIDNDGE